MKQDRDEGVVEYSHGLGGLLSLKVEGTAGGNEVFRGDESAVAGEADLVGLEKGIEDGLVDGEQLQLVPLPGGSNTASQSHGEYPSCASRRP